MVITKLYLNRQYTEYLVGRTYEAEYKVLQLAKSNINIMMDEFIQLGCLAATDDELYNNSGKLRNPDTFTIYKSEVSNKISSYAYYSQWVRGVTVSDSEKILLEYWRGSSEFRWDQENADRVYEACASIVEKKKKQAIPLYSYIGTTKDEQAGETLFHLAFPIVGTSGGKNCSCIIVFSLSEKLFEDSLEMETVGDQTPLAYGFITDTDGRILYHTDEALIGIQGSSYVEEEKLDVLQAGLQRLNWTLNIGIDEVEMRANVNDLYRSGFILYCLWLVCIFVILFVVITRLVRPIKYISESIDSIKEGDYSEQIEIQGSNEIWKLAGEFNSMTRAISRMRTKIEEEHHSHLLAMKRMQEAEKEALESQINAHFICNTIGAINYEAIEAGNRRVSTMLKKLSNILRYTFDQKHQRVYMEQEIAWLEQYLYLQKVRYEEEFEYQIEIPKEVYGWPCCKMIFQPFVENSILHGFEGVEEGGLIWITGVLLDEDTLKLEIGDNGNGMSEEVCRAIQRAAAGTEKNFSLGIGIVNVVSRLKYYYGDAAAFSLDSQPGRGTVVTLIVPRNMEQT